MDTSRIFFHNAYHITRQRNIALPYTQMWLAWAFATPDATEILADITSGLFYTRFANLGTPKCYIIYVIVSYIIKHQVY